MKTQDLISKRFDHFDYLFQEYRESSNLTRPVKASKLLSQVDSLSLSVEGISFLYDQLPALSAAGIFEQGPWSDPGKLVPTLVNGTLKAGHPTSSIELLSELRILAILKGEIDTTLMNPDDAEEFLEEVIVHNLEFVFQAPSEETRTVMSEHELSKVSCLFSYLLDKVNLSGIKEKLAEEITMLCEQRPVVTSSARSIIRLVKEKVKLDKQQAVDKVLIDYVDALYAPTKGSRTHPDTKLYEAYLFNATERELQAEASDMGGTMRAFGLVSRFHAVLLQFLVQEGHEDLVPEALDLSSTGRGEWEEHNKFLRKLIRRIVHPDHPNCIYGISRMLEKGHFSRRPIRAGLDNLVLIKMNNKVEKRILKSVEDLNPDISALQYLLGDLIQVLGSPLGVGQGSNPTCQSARGISMWSQHAPAKLINMVITAVTQNNLIFRFEGKDLESSLLSQGLMTKLDYKLDAVSLVLVPHLDKIYNEMMRLAAGRFEDPHKWVNPAMYGQWIQIGFASCYDYLSNSIHDFEGFQRIFHASFHLDYNEGLRIIYPNPLGIFVTSSRGEMLGFHAISLLRVVRRPDGSMRAYFLNPNNEGRQDWGQGITPTVKGNGEKHGESSLPFHQLAARVYAFHYNSLEVKHKLENIPADALGEVVELARDSWGKSYTWNETPRQW